MTQESISNSTNNNDCYLHLLEFLSLKNIKVIFYQNRYFRFDQLYLTILDILYLNFIKNDFHRKKYEKQSLKLLIS